jgi:hypothetical protein
VETAGKWVARWKRRLVPDEIGDRRDAGIDRARGLGALLDQPAPIDQATCESIRRYEHQRPGDLIHVDVNKLGRIPDGGGWRYLGAHAAQEDAQPLRTERPDPETPTATR